MDLLDSNNGPALDTLRISDQDWIKLLAKLHRAAGKYHGTERRENRRNRLHAIIKMTAQFQYAGGRTESYIIRTRNISDTGICFLHGSFLPNGVEVNLVLNALDGALVPVDGHVVRCRHVHGKVHEVGVQFVDPITVEYFIPGLKDKQATTDASSESTRTA